MERDLTKEFLENCLKTAQFSEKKIDELKQEDNNFNEDIELLKRLIDS